MLIGVVNNSSMVSNTDVQTMVSAIQIQLDLHCAPAWNEKSVPVRFYSNAASVPGYAWTIYIIDNDAQVAGALGFHEEETNGKIDGYIMCRPILSNGGDVLKFDPANPGKYTVSGTLSHEILETFINRFTNVFCDNGTTSWCREICDAVEQVGYGQMVNGVNVSLSDFVFPNFYNQYAVLPRSAPLNFLNTLKAPFTILAGGYAIQRTGGPGTETQVFGELMPQWRRDMKKHDLARFNRRSK